VISLLASPAAKLSVPPVDAKSLGAVAVLLSVAKSTLAGSSVAPVFVTVKVNSVVPLLPSALLTLSIAKVGAASSLSTVPSPWSSAIVAPDAFERLTKKISFASKIVSPFTSTVIVLLASPAVKVSVPPVDA
jgi:hypothetical protein